jgi:Tol biopolymer transport system component
MGQVLKLNLRTGKVQVLVDDPRGGVRDPQVNYEGDKILFSYRKGGTPYYHLYEINANGTDLKDLTTGPWDDFEPTYTAYGDIVFVSTRAKRWVNCWKTHVAVLYRMDADGGHMRPIRQRRTRYSPLLPTAGSYTRWEYGPQPGALPSPVDGQPRRHAAVGLLRQPPPGRRTIDAKPIAGTRR